VSVPEAAGREPFVSYVEDDPSVNWSDELELLHEESSRTHFLDRWTRAAILTRVGAAELPPEPTVLDLGCSTGHLLADLHAAYPRASLIGVDLVAAGLRKAHAELPSARLLRADACSLPLQDGSVDVVVSANLLEHIPDDRAALSEVTRVLTPGGVAVFVVPFGPGTYDYYDRFLGHERRYARGELAAKCAAAGLEPLEDRCIGAVLYPPFWLVKQRNRRRYDNLDDEELTARVAADIRATRDSRAGVLAWRFEELLARAGLRPRFGIRSLVCARRRPS
jgi:SAM-dependent methyltransferase